MNPFFFSQSIAAGVYLNRMSPFLSPSNSQGFTITVSPGRIQSLLLRDPGILQFRSLSSRHFTIIRFPPTRCSTIPMTSPSLGVLTLTTSVETAGRGAFFFDLSFGFGFFMYMVMCKKLGI